MTAPDREAPSTSWAVWAWQAYRDGRLVEVNPAAIREAALREAARVADRFADKSIVDAAFWRKDGMPNASVLSEEHAKAARLVSADILALIQKGGINV